MKQVIIFLIIFTLVTLMGCQKEISKDVDKPISADKPIIGDSTDNSKANVKVDSTEFSNEIDNMLVSEDDDVEIGEMI